MYLLHALSGGGGGSSDVDGSNAVPAPLGQSREAEAVDAVIAEVDCGQLPESSEKDLRNLESALCQTFGFTLIILPNFTFSCFVSIPCAAHLKNTNPPNKHIKGDGRRARVRDQNLDGAFGDCGHGSRFFSALGTHAG